MATTNITKLYVALDGTLVKSTNTSITRGNDSVNQIQYITPFDTSFTMECNFQLANGELVSSKPLTLRDTEVLDIGSIYDGETWAVKGYDVESAILSTLSKLVASPLYTSAVVKEANPNYLGSYADETAILLITGMVDEDYVYNEDTATSWEYDLGTTTWSDLLFEKTIWSSTQYIPASSEVLSVNPSIISSSEEISQTAVELLTAWLNDVEVELAKMKTQADGNFEKTNDDVWSSDKRVNTFLENYYMQIANYDSTDSGDTVDKAFTLDDGLASATAEDTEEVIGRVNQDLKDTASPTFVKVNATTIDFGTRELTDNTTDDTLDLKLNDNVTLQVGQEELVFAYNSGTTIANGKVVYISGASGNRPTVALASNVAKATAHATIGISTEELTQNESHFVTTRGFVRGLDTSAFSEGDQLFLGVDGALVNVEPTAPTYKVEVGICITSNAGAGIVYVNVEKLHIIEASSDVKVTGSAYKDILVRNSTDEYWENVQGDTMYMSRDIQNGAFKESFDLLYNTTTSEMVLTNADGITDSLTMQFSDGDTSLDTTSLSLAPTFGTATVPVANYFYILKSAKVLAKSTSSFPSAEHIKVAELVLLDEIQSDSEGLIGNRNWNNHETGDYSIGALQHIRARIRRMGAQWYSGIGGATSGEWVNDVAGSLYWTSNAGAVLQMHPQTYTAKDTSGTDDMHIVNDFTAPYDSITSFDEILTYSDGSSIGNDYFNVFVYGICNKGGEYTPIFVNTPTAGYNNLTDAQSDLDGTTVTTVPTLFRETAFPIARLLLRKLGGTYSFIQSYDLREQKFGISGTSGTGVLDGEFIDTTFELQNVTDNTKVMKFDASPQTSGTTRTVSMADTDIDLADIALKVPKDLSVLTEDLTLAGAMKVYIEDGTTPKRTTIDGIATYIGALSGSVLNTGKYYDTGLGSHDTALVKMFTMLNSADADVYADIIDTSIITDFYTSSGVDKFIRIVVGSSLTDDTQDARLSIDNGSTYHDILVNGGNVNGSVLLGKELELKYTLNGWEVDLQSLSQQLSLDSNIDSTYNTVSPIDGSPQLNTVYGLSLNQLTVLGDVATSMAGADGNEIGVANDGTWTDTSYSYTSTERTYNLISGNDYMYIMKLSDGAIKADLRIRYATSTIQIVSLTQDGDLSYILFTANATELANVNVLQDGTTTPVRDYQMLIDITNTPLASHTATQINNIVDTYIEGYTYIQDFELQSIGLNMANILIANESRRGNYQTPTGTVTLSVSGDTINATISQTFDGVGITASVKSGADYTYSYSSITNVNNIRLTFLDIDLNTISEQNIVNEETVTTPSNARYVEYGFFNTATTGVIEIVDPQVEQGTTASDYKAYNSPQDNFTLTNIDGTTLDLLSVGTSIRDIVYPLNGVWWYKQYVGIDETNYSSSSWSDGTDLGSYYRFQITNPLDVKMDGAGNYANTPYYLKIGDTVYPYLEEYALDTLHTYMFTTNIRVYALKTEIDGYTGANAIDKFKDYLSSNDWKLVYEYDTPLDAVEIEHNGSLIQESNTTLIQSNVFATEYDITFSLDSDKQTELNTEKIIYHQAEIDDLEVRVEDLENEIDDELSQEITYTSSVESTYNVLAPVNGTPELTQVKGLSLNQPFDGSMTTDTNWTISNATGSVISGVYEFTATAVNGAIYQNIDLIDTHKYYVVAKVKADSSDVVLRIPSTNIDTHSGGGEYEILSAIYTATATGSNPIVIRDERASGWTQVDVDYVMAIPITNTPIATYTATQIDNIINEYIEGYTAVENFELQSIGVNLFDKNDYNVLDDVVISPTSLTATVGGKTIYISIKQNIDYVISRAINSERFRIGTTNELPVSGATLNNYEIDDNALELTLNSGDDKYLCVYYYYATADTTYTDVEILDGLQIEQGTTSTDYVEYNSPTNFKLNTTLRSVGTDIQDISYYNNNVWVKDNYVGYDYNDVVQSTTSWSITNILTNTHEFFKDLESVLGYKTGVNNIASNISCKIGDTDFKVVSADYSYANDEENLVLINVGDRLSIRVNKTTYATTGDFETYLQANDVLFTYELDEIVQEEIDKDGSLIQEEVTTLVQHASIATEYNVNFTLNMNKQIEENTGSIVYLQNEIDKVEASVETLNTEQDTQDGRLDSIETKTDYIDVSEIVYLDKVPEYTEIYSGTLSVPTSTTLPSSNITLSESFANFDELKIFVDYNSLGRVKISNIMPDSFGDTVIADYKQGITTAGNTVKNFKLYFQSSTLLSAYYGESIVSTYGSPANIVRSTDALIQITKIIGVKY